MIFTHLVHKFAPNTFGKYLLATTGYGLLSRAYHTNDATVRREGETCPMLIRDKATVMLIGALTAIEFWPFYVFADIGKLELNLRGEYRKPAYNHWVDYLFPT